jgi:hypothetical protein
VGEEQQHSTSPGINERKVTAGISFMNQGEMDIGDNE